MANDCLISKFNGTYDDDTLDIYNTLVIDTVSVSANNGMFSVGGTADAPLEISWDGEGVYTNPTTKDPRTSPIVSTNGAVIGFFAPVGTSHRFKVKGIYKLNTININDGVTSCKGINHIFYAPLSDLVQDNQKIIKKVDVNNTASIQLRNLDDTVDVMLDVSTYTTSHTSVVVQYTAANSRTGVSGSIEGITNRCPNATRIQLPYTKITGNIDNIGAYTKITYLIVSGTNCIGTLEAFVEGVAQKATFPSYCYLEADETLITFHETPLVYGKYITKSDNIVSVRAASSSGTVLATYNTSTGIWTYNN